MTITDLSEYDTRYESSSYPALLQPIFGESGNVILNQNKCLNKYLPFMIIDKQFCNGWNQFGCYIMAVQGLLTLASQHST